MKRKKKKVYVETTIPSYLVARASRDVIVAGHQQVTSEWWNTRRSAFDLFVSSFVLDEIALGDRKAVAERVEVIKGIPELRITDEVAELAVALVSPRAIPRQAAQDAAHIAVAAVHQMDYLLTWNCAHIANAEIIPGVESICRAYGYICPFICTPEELMGG